LSALLRVRFSSFSDLVNKGFYVDGHPGGVQVFLYYWTRLVGNSEAAVRLPFVFSGILTVWISYIVSSRWFNKVTGLFVALTIAFLELPILYSQIARPYASGLFFSMLMVFFWTHLLFDLKNANKLRKIFILLGYTLSTAACMYNHYFSFLFAALVGATGLFFLNKANAKYYLLCGLASIVLFIPHVPITINHLQIGGVGEWLGKPGLFWLAEHIFYIFNESYLLLFFVIVIFILSIIISVRKFRLNKFQLISIIWFLFPFLVGYFYSREVNPVLQHSVLIFSFPFLIFFLFSFIEMPLDRNRLIAFIILAMIGLYSFLLDDNYYKKQHFGEFKDIAFQISTWDEAYGSENITKAINVNHPWYIQYYLNRNRANVQFEQYENKGGMDLLDLKHIVDAASTDYFLYAWTKPAPSVIEDIIRVDFPFIAKKIDYGDLSAVTLFSKTDNGTIYPEPKPIRVVTNGFEDPGLWNADELHLDTEVVFNGQFSYRFDTTVLYGPAYYAKVIEISAKPFRLIKVSLMAYSPGTMFKTPLVISIDTPEGKNCCWAGTNLDYYMDPGVWNHVFFQYELPEIQPPSNILKIYVWNNQLLDFYVDDIKIAFYE
ncbi:MAG: glycosyltransferase family 39 protein, partial [Bacteroidales bacterium]|nr:glycosyltransferase family 39 protein [Bacteroidales bacterium]